MATPSPASHAASPQRLGLSTGDSQEASPPRKGVASGCDAAKRQATLAVDPSRPIYHQPIPAPLLRLEPRSMGLAGLAPVRPLRAETRLAGLGAPASVRDPPVYPPWLAPEPIRGGIRETSTYLGTQPLRVGNLGICTSSAGERDGFPIPIT